MNGNVPFYALKRVNHQGACRKRSSLGIYERKEISISLKYIFQRDTRDRKFLGIVVLRLEIIKLTLGARKLI